MKFPGLVTECKEMMEKLNLPDITYKDTIEDWSKGRWKSAVKKKIRSWCETELKDKMKGYSKLRDGPMQSEFLA